MSNYSRGRDLQIQILEDDGSGGRRAVPLGSPVSATFNMDTTNERDDRLGEYEADTTQVYEGESGTVTFRNDSSVLHGVMMRIRTAARSGQKTPKFQIIRTIRVPEDGSSRTLQYPNVVFSFSEEASGKNDAIEISTEFLGGFAVEV